MNIFEHVRLIKIIKFVLLTPLIGLALYLHSRLTIWLGILLFAIILLDFILIDKAHNDYRNLYHSAYFDALTRIPNRLSADRYVAGCGSPDKVSVVVADLDGLKAANDQFGHLAGDVMIRDFGSLFFRTALPEGFAARNGGDEFLAIFRNDGNGVWARRFCRRLQVSLDHHNATAEYPITYSIGVSWGQGGDYESIQQLISQADHRMYLNKRGKKEKLHIIDDSNVDTGRKEEEDSEKVD